jgi:serine/threonine protein kinase
MFLFHMGVTQQLLTRDPTKRLGSEDKMASDIRRHPFFKHIDWDQLYRKEIEAPFKPKVNSVLDLTWIDPIFKEENVRSLTSTRHTTHTLELTTRHDTTRHAHTGDRFRGGEVEDGRDGRWR